MSQQRTWKFIVKIRILMTLLTDYSFGYNYTKINENIKLCEKISIISKYDYCSTWVKYRNVLPNNKNANMGSSSIQHFTVIHSHFDDMIDMQIQNLL